MEEKVSLKKVVPTTGVICLTLLPVLLTLTLYGSFAVIEPWDEGMLFLKRSDSIEEDEALMRKLASTWRRPTPSIDVVFVSFSQSNISSTFLPLSSQIRKAISAQCVKQQREVPTVLTLSGRVTSPRDTLAPAGPSPPTHTMLLVELVAPADNQPLVACWQKRGKHFWCEVALGEEGKAAATTSRVQSAIEKVHAAMDRTTIHSAEKELRTLMNEIRTRQRTHFDTSAGLDSILLRLFTHGDLAPATLDPTRTPTVMTQFGLPLPSTQLLYEQHLAKLSQQQQNGDGKGSSSYGETTDEVAVLRDIAMSTSWSQTLSLPPEQLGALNLVFIFPAFLALNLVFRLIRLQRAKRRERGAAAAATKQKTD